MNRHFGMKTAAVIALLASASAAIAGQTPWLDRDNPGGTGDWENMAALVTKVECSVIATGQSTVGLSGYKCDVAGGSICTNSAALACQHTQIRYTFDDRLGHSIVTPWLNRDTPSGTGDWETTSDLLKVECKFTDDNSPVTASAGAAYRCSNPDSRSGGTGVNANNGGKPVRNMAVRFSF
jgi:Mucin-2 protein WxxW repeating region